jgi:hypothetical protein
MNNKPVLNDKYFGLQRVLLDALEQAAGGKGKERHADGEVFENQKICVINRWLAGSPIAGPLFQAVKKTVESSRMAPDRAIRELYGAINYLAAGIILLEEMMAVPNKPIPDDPTIDHVNAEIRRINDLRIKQEVERIEQKTLAHIEKAGLFLPGGEPVTDHPDEMAVFEAPVCNECFHMKVMVNDMPCKKCIDKPFRPHFTQSLPVYNEPPMPV